MIIRQLFYPQNNKQLKKWFLLHLGVGALTLISNLFVIAWFYIILIQGIQFIISARTTDSKHIRIIYLLMYIAPFEIITRMTKCAPIIPYELGKYITFLLLLLGLSFSAKSNKMGYVLIVLLIPGIIIGWPKAPDYRSIIFNIMGFIAQASIGVLSSESEGLPVSLLEYGMAGLPVVVTEVGQCAEVLEHGKFGLIVPPKNPELFANALLTIINEQEKFQEMGLAYKHHVETNYGKDNFIHQYLKALDTKLI